MRIWIKYRQKWANSKYHRSYTVSFSFQQCFLFWNAPCCGTLCPWSPSLQASFEYLVPVSSSLSWCWPVHKYDNYQTMSQHQQQKCTEKRRRVARVFSWKVLIRIFRSVFLVLSPSAIITESSSQLKMKVLHWCALAIIAFLHKLLALFWASDLSMQKTNTRSLLPLLLLQPVFSR